ncbi:MAG: bifunctional oligoribonuclease/PAP phosphatase NrnA, partial [Paludibacteraceae bacterium]|nr:bifunctional oligoribonuclease/PAP phosphatase NrnA [Paludibacteraceae bacterium]
GISCSVFVSEDKEKVKLSWRSRGDFAVNEICSKYFNGGGHKNASGGEVFGGNINEILEQVRTILKNK